MKELSNKPAAIFTTNSSGAATAGKGVGAKAAMAAALANPLTAGIAAGLGIAAAGAVSGTFLALGSTVIVPIAAGVGVAYASIKVWNKLLHKATA